MNVRKMLLFDRWLGVPLCFVFTGLRWLIARAKRSDSKVERILFIKLAEQGSTVLAYPALREAVHRVGRQNVYMMVFDNNRFVLDALDVIPPENVIPLRHSNLFVPLLGGGGGASAIAPDRDRCGDRPRIFCAVFGFACRHERRMGANRIPCLLR